MADEHQEKKENEEIENHRETENYQETEQEKPKAPPWIFLLYLLPLFMAITVALMYWIKKINAPKIQLTPSQESAFIAPIEIKRISALDKKKSKEVEEKIKKSLKKTPREKMLERRQKRELEKKFRIIGSTPGKLLESVEYAFKNPSAIKALFNNEIVIEEFLKRETVKPLLADVEKLKDFLINDPKTGEFFDNLMVSKIINNQEILLAIAESKFIDKILKSPAIKKLINSPQLRREITEANPRLGLLTANYNLLNALKANPNTEHIAKEYTDL
ncbi:MAG TPA: hypothetical protein VMW66_03495 [Elusimicrobiales bacterium]|nr:hypothetical protein [Elusimicrobiales bacterium]